MIVGGGMLANAFAKYVANEDIVIFASGVSNSSERNPLCFEREKNLLLETIQKYPLATLVYFGTCSVGDPELFNSPYVNHKKAMEVIVQENCKHYFIFRLSQVVGKSSSPTLINFLVNKIKEQEPFSIWKNSTRNLIDVDDVYRIASYFIEKNFFINTIINIAAPFSLPIFKIVATIEDVLGQNGVYIVEDRGGSYEINTDKIAIYLGEIGVVFGKQYLSKILKKYFLLHNKYALPKELTYAQRK